MPESLIGAGPTAWWTHPDGQPGPVLRECIAAATTAPSVHNTQPWLFRLRRGGIDAYADPRRTLRVIDPAGRELYLSLGAAIFTMRVATRAYGRVPVQRLLPEPAVPDLVARITFGTAVPPSTTVRSLYWAITHRHSNRWPFTDLAVPRSLLAELAAAAAAEGATLTVAGPALRETLLGLVRTAERQWAANTDYQRELASWTASIHTDDGIPAWAFGPRSPAQTFPLRDLGLLHPAARRTATFEARPTLALLHTPDGPESWLRAGQALQRVLLTATLRGLATTLMTQPLEIPTLRDRLAHPATGHHAQAIIRLGYGRHTTKATPRRPVSDVLLPADPPHPGHRPLPTRYSIVRTTTLSTNPTAKAPPQQHDPPRPHRTPHNLFDDAGSASVRGGRDERLQHHRDNDDEAEEQLGAEPVDPGADGAGGDAGDDVPRRHPRWMDNGARAAKDRGTAE